VVHDDEELDRGTVISTVGDETSVSFPISCIPVRYQVRREIDCELSASRSRRFFF
jgi:hypothetical protein